MKIKIARKKWFTPKQMRSFKKLCSHVAGHYPKDRQLAASVRGCFASFDECATKLSKKASKTKTWRKKSARRGTRRTARRMGTRRMRRGAMKRWSGRRSWRRSRRARRAA
jgi:hypothetical protein